ncbi:MAG: ABC transporter permease subunit [Alphaproteobacteria bacterium]|nr:ABC transporter permease subunit [Alphaproteobacteria bacterium]
MTDDLRALTWITADLARRLLREPQVVRSLLWPIALVPLTLMFTVFGFVWLEGDWPVAVQDGVDPAVVAALEEGGFQVARVPDARAAVADGGFRSGTDGETVYAGAIRGRVLQVERVLREHRGASWKVAEPPPPKADESQGGRVMGVIGVLFVLFGVVFGAGMVARDRDDGTLEAQLALGVRRWVHGTARWIAGTAVLAGHYLLAMAVLHAILGIEDPLRVGRNGLAACAGAVAIGLFVVGRAGLKSGFSGPLASGLSIATGLAAAGAALPAVGRLLPVASLLTASTGWLPLGGALGLGAVAIALFTFRSARA